MENIALPPAIPGSAAPAARQPQPSAPGDTLTVSFNVQELPGNPGQVIVARTEQTSGLKVETTAMGREQYRQITDIAGQLAEVTPDAAIKNSATQALIALSTSGGVQPEAVNREAMQKVALGAAGKAYNALVEEFSAAAAQPKQLAVPSQQLPSPLDVTAANVVANAQNRDMVLKA